MPSIRRSHVFGNSFLFLFRLLSHMYILFHWSVQTICTVWNLKSHVFIWIFKTTLYAYWSIKQTFRFIVFTGERNICKLAVTRIGNVPFHTVGLVHMAEWIFNKAVGVSAAVWVFLVSMTANVTSSRRKKRWTEKRNDGMAYASCSIIECHEVSWLADDLC